ncbi:class Ib ribonucleoside-diphosphate reductase assembly flavoprotein NrdI [Leifsonia sp. Leaf264]|uniref:class Ib ribonucleoside-diphosphate reductase assembly flavoprotein NrdI n=1 Tax=Leifsonia sp. Leaf264 TaxID=1736314 RepID=UPI0006FA044A|nr:class Ib ribonucleoside-diphosphate reductase assembly flavoprotein NrdI [Leifsonia sp. Leaf264]KQO98885.1 hypothetical protein ASF30_12550 [Leifsonia sp. Leaf264]
MSTISYFSSVSGNTHRFVESLDLPATRLPVMTKDDTVVMESPHVLILPTYGGGNDGGAVPKQVIKFLNHPDNRALLRGVIGAGNTNFGEAYCLAARIVAEKCNVPLLYTFEVFGTPDDRQAVLEGLEAFWKQQP